MAIKSKSAICNQNLCFCLTTAQSHTAHFTNINEFLDYNFTAKMQSDSAGLALSSIITKMIKNNGFPFSVYSTLFEACVCSISLYGGEVFGYAEYESQFRIHTRAIRAFLGLPKQVTSFGLVSELE